MRYPPCSALYASFDRVPSPKGAATHIERFAGALCGTFGSGLIHALGSDDLLPFEKEGPAVIIRYNRPHGHFLDRTLGYGRSLANVIDQVERGLELCHFRDPWSGVPILDRPHGYKTIYEVNGLPSIELPYTYPHLSPQTLGKIRQAERYCWENCDVILTPSQTLADNLIRLGAEARRILVVPNGADPVDSQPPRPGDAPSRYLIYFGALQPWQGVDILLKAFQRLLDVPDLRLVLCSSSHRRIGRAYEGRIERLGLTERVLWKQGVTRSELRGWIAHASATVAPLTECSRNLDQGCAPLKILESMALGIPIVASDLPSVREIVRPGSEARLVQADRPAELARAIRIVLEYPEVAQAMGLRAKARLESGLTWAHSLSALKKVYLSLSTAHRLHNKDNP